MAPKLNEGQLDRASEIYMGIGHISVASVVIPTLIDKLDIKLSISSIAITIAFWVASVMILKKQK